MSPYQSARVRRDNDRSDWGMPPCTHYECPGQNRRVQRVIAYVLGASNDPAAVLNEIMWVHDHKGLLIVYTRHEHVPAELLKLIQSTWAGPMANETAESVEFIWINDFIGGHLGRRY